MSVSLVVSKRVFLVIASLMIIIALVVAIFIIPDVKMEVLRGGTPEKVITAFWVNILFNILAALTLIFITLKSQERNWITTSILLLVALVILILGWALNDAGVAYSNNGPEMATASTMLILCGTIELILFILVLVFTFLRPKQNG